MCAVVLKTVKDPIKVSNTILTGSQNMASNTVSIKHGLQTTDWVYKNGLRYKTALYGNLMKGKFKTRLDAA